MIFFRRGVLLFLFVCLFFVCFLLLGVVFFLFSLFGIFLISIILSFFVVCCSLVCDWFGDGCCLCWVLIIYFFVFKLLFLNEFNPLSYFSFQPVLHDWCNKDRGMCYPVCGMVHIKEPLLLIDKSSICGGCGFPFSLSEWSFTICLTPYNRR